jgi:hypothetical protein
MDTITSYIVRFDNRKVVSSVTTSHWYSGYSFVCKNHFSNEFYLLNFFGPFYVIRDGTRFEAFPRETMAPWDGTPAYSGWIHYEGLAVGCNGDIWSVTDNAIVRIDMTKGPQYVAGHPTQNGNVIADGKDARFKYLRGVTVSNSGNVYFSDIVINRVYKMSPSGNVVLLAGGGASGAQSGYVDGPGKSALFSGPSTLAVDQDEVVYVTDEGNRRIRKIEPDGQTTTIAGNGTNAHVDGRGKSASFCRPRHITIDQSSNLYVEDYRSSTGSCFMSRVDESGGCVTMAGPNNGLGFCWSWMCDRSGTLYYTTNTHP